MGVVVDAVMGSGADEESSIDPSALFSLTMSFEVPLQAGAINMITTARAPRDRRRRAPMAATKVATGVKHQRLTRSVTEGGAPARSVTVGRGVATLVARVSWLERICERTGRSTGGVP